jgi:hypothetical protein
VPYTTVVAGTTVTASWANTNVRDQVVTPFADAASRTSAISGPVEGMMSFLRDVNRLDFYNGSAWQPVIGAGAKVVRTGDMSITSGVATNIEWQSTSHDAHGMWSGGNPTRLTAPWTGMYLATATVRWASQDLGFIRRTALMLNGTMIDQSADQLNNTAATNIHTQNVASGVRMTAGQFIETQVLHDAGPARTIELLVTNATLVYLGSG